MPRMFHFALCAVFTLPAVVGADEDSDLAAQVHALLKERCYNCHGLTEQEPGLQILERDVLTSGPSRGGMPWLTPGDPEASRIWKQVAADYMPQDEPLSAEQKALLKRWIEQSAPFPSQIARRSFISHLEILKTIRNYLTQEVDADNVRFQRFFSLAHLHNHPEVSSLQLQMTRAALSKVLNSVSREGDIVLPVAIDEAQTIFAIDLRDFGWTDSSSGLRPRPSVDWRAVVKAHPYGLRPRNDAELNVFDQIERQYGVDSDGVPYIRADWFVAHASRPPLYHTLAAIPDTLADLEEQIGVDRISNFRNEKLLRGAVQQSGVSAQNRLLERHTSDLGRYWISFDFKSNAGRGNLVRFPLGPKFDGNPFQDSFAFEHDGGEIIYERPNGMDGYMLIDAAGNRIDKGPIEIVRDLKESAGTPQIVNGVSCMACHRQGVIDFVDTIRENPAVFDQDAARKLNAIYGKPQQVREVLDEDRQDYVRTLRKVIGPFLDQTEYEARLPEEYPEPVREVARHYEKDLELLDVALELGLENTDGLKGRMDNVSVRLLGVGPLLTGHTIKRSMWDSKAESGGTSVFQLVAQELNIGVPR